MQLTPVLGTDVGRVDGNEEGITEGILVGMSVDSQDGDMVGPRKGLLVGSSVESLGIKDGNSDVGCGVGTWGGIDVEGLDVGRSGMQHRVDDGAPHVLDVKGPV